MSSTEDRYRTLLDASSTLADQPTVKAVLHSLRGVLSSTSRLHGAELCVLSDDGESLFTFDPQPVIEMKEYLELVSKQWDVALARLKTFVEGDQH